MSLTLYYGLSQYYPGEEMGIIKRGTLVPLPRKNLAFENGRISEWTGKWCYLTLTRTSILWERDDYNFIRAVLSFITRHTKILCCYRIKGMLNTANSLDITFEIVYRLTFFYGMTVRSRNRLSFSYVKKYTIITILYISFIDAHCMHLFRCRL